MDFLLNIARQACLAVRMGMALGQKTFTFCIDDIYLVASLIPCPRESLAGLPGYSVSFGFLSQI